MARAKQQKIPGIPEYAPSDPALVEKLEELRLVRAERIELQQKEKQVLNGVLAHHHGMTDPPAVVKYLDEDDKPRVAKFKTITKVSVRSEESADDDDDGNDGDNDDGGVNVQ